MPRAPRIDIPGLVYHITNRGVRKLPIFHCDADCRQFLRFLNRAKREFPFQLHAYCLMTNHFHLLLQTVDHSLSKTMHYFKTLYAGWFNHKYGHVGPPFQARFHSIPVEEDAYLTTVARYIHLNPVRAGIVERPEDYVWSDFGRLMHGEMDGMVDPKFLLGYFGNDPAKQRERYRQFVYDELTKPAIITERSLQRMRFWGKPPLQLRKFALAQERH